jgi:hypothetical protein
MTMAGINSITVGSNSAAPDLDWSQIRETLRMLNLAVAQIQYSMREGDDSVLALGESFTAMAGGIDAILKLLEGTPVAEPAQEKCKDLSAKVNSAIVPFQFYDKLTQKLGHVSASLSALSELVSNNSRLYNPQEWMGLQQQIRSAYTVEDEREVFDALMRGVPVSDAMELTRSKSKAPNDSDIELF